MKTVYLFKLKRIPILFAVSVYTFFCFGQTVKIPNLVEVLKPVVGPTEREDMVFSFECAAAWGDFDNDGYLDLITAGAGHSWVKTTILYKNNGDGTFTKINHSFPALQNASVVWLDYNNDGNLDLFLSGIDDIGIYSGLFKNLGPEMNYAFEEVFEGAFRPLYNGGGNRGNRYAVAGDYDNDGWVDLYIQGKNEEGVQAYLYKNERGTGFSEICPINGLHSFLKLYANGAVFTDYDNDGFLDIITGGYSDIADRPSTGAYYRNNGDGTFAEPVLFEGAVNGEVAATDYNNDGKSDFVMTGYSFLSGVGWQGDLFENNGNNTFSRILPGKTQLPGTQDCSIACGDVNNDGFEDILFLYSHPNALYLNNFGNKTFTKVDLKYNYNGDPNTTFDQNGGMVCLVDFDRDNDLDIFTMGYGGNFLPGLLRNDLGNGIPENAPPSIPTGLNAEVNKEGDISFSWNASTDDHTPQNALKYNLYVKKETGEEMMFVLPADPNTGLLKVNETLAPITTNSYKMFGLESGNYTFGVQALDNGKLTSKFAVSSFTTDASGIQTPQSSLVDIYKKDNTWIISCQTCNQHKITVYNMQGIAVKAFSGNSSHTVIDNLASGVYVVKIKINNELIIKKIIL